MNVADFIPSELHTEYNLEEYYYLIMNIRPDLFLFYLGIARKNAHQQNVYFICYVSETAWKYFF